uniref:C3H1-type domain-containing protein n=1 Tax=Zooxanthella nutricula TaxID=1333877 RepID=A0A7S2PTU7_9DINO|eukprot:CAMPEP_0198541318 /NCGR_PEP_ID=MMETSP1462-20131121/53678_1 /TAXON_ID=1333877 /ORGANISM="Brandtodinium nutriculum, Strain RCC3387" /LENGTH=444 /DNA_ID=CAMNT_0044271473 /DNA_START=73 /DNA_END=1407 /DNA_ORIENTATION=-
MWAGILGLGRSLLGGPDAEGEEGDQAGEADAKVDGPQLPIKAAEDRAEKGSPGTPAASPASTVCPTQSEGSATKSDGSARSGGLPEFEYPSPAWVHNTFVEAPVRSLDAAFRASREAKSCPTSTISAPPGLPQMADADDENTQVPRVPLLGTSPVSSPTAAGATASPVRPALWPRTFSAETLEAALIAAAEAKATATPVGSPTAALAFEPPAFWPRTMSGDGLDASLAALIESSPLGAALAAPHPMFWPRTMSGDDLEASLSLAEAVMDSQHDWTTPIVPAAGDRAAPAVPPPPQQLPPALLETKAVPPPPAASAHALDSQVVSLADALPEPELGTAALPTAGSRGHRLGNCKPCAFLHTKGCKNGKECPFCHLCERGEKKRRRKEKWQQGQQHQHQQKHMQHQLQAQAVQAAHAAAALAFPPAVGFAPSPAGLAPVSLAAAIR